jgi:hypothetical protein
MILIVFCLGWSISVLAKESTNPTPETVLEGMSAREAVAVANRWRWTQKDITSYVTPREVVFQFPSGNSTRIPLPKNEVLVSVAPYINNTHE